MEGRSLPAEETLFSMVEKLLQTASLAGQRRNLRVASNCLRRAYSICTKRADAGLLAGRVARAMVAVQLCALSSKAKQHAEALEEALKAIREAEEVWSILQDKSEDLQTPLAQRALVVLIQAKHCVAIELEYTLADKMQSSQASMIREMIPALHEEAAALARLLPERSALRKVSFRTKAQEASRRAAEPDAHGSLVTIAEGHAAESCPPGFAWREPTELALELFQRPEHFYEQQTPEHVPRGAVAAAYLPRASVQAAVEPLAGPEQPKPRPQSAPSRFTSRLDTLEDQLLVPPTPVRLPVVEQQEELPQAQARAGSRRRGRHARGEKPNYSAGMWWKRREDPGKDVFQQWLLATAAKEPRGGAVLTEPMLKTLKSELKLKFRQFQEEMPFFSAQDLYENKILFSHYGVKVRSQARKEAAQKEGKEVKEKVVRSKTHRRPSTNPTLLSVKSMATRLQDSQNAIPETKETREFLYMIRREQGNEIYEGLRKAYYHTKEVPPEAPPTRSQSHRRL